MSGAHCGMRGTLRKPLQQQGKQDGKGEARENEVLSNVFILLSFGFLKHE